MKEKIYLLPGLMTDERLWSRLIPFLEKEYELIHTPLPLSDDFEEISKELERVFEEDKINLLGFSLGSYIASYFSVKNPQRINRLFLLAGTPSRMNEDEIQKRRLTLKQMNNLGFKGLSHKKVLSLIENKNHHDEELIKIIKDMFVDLGKDVYNIQMNSTFNREDLYKELTNLSFPIKFFYSNQDRLFNHNSLKYIKKEHKNITILLKDGSSHMLPLEEPKILAQEIKNWMN